MKWIMFQEDITTIETVSFDTNNISGIATEFIADDKSFAVVVADLEKNISVMAIGSQSGLPSFTDLSCQSCNSELSMKAATRFTSTFSRSGSQNSVVAVARFRFSVPSSM
jgi:hypothetical protein